MATQLLTEKYAESLDGVLGCYDRLVITGSLCELCYAKGMTHYLYAHDIRIFDYTRFTAPLRDAIRTNAASIAKSAGVEIEFIRKKDFRKEDRIQARLAERGTQPGLVHVFSAMEPCASYQPWHDKASGHTYVKPDSGKCLHYYFYFIDADLGLCYLRVPTWCPFRLQFYCNGHARLATQLTGESIGATALDNAFIHIADYDRANALAAQWDGDWLRRKLDDWAQRYCPVVATLQLSYYWSLMQVEYALDLVFKTPSALSAFYPHLLETLIQAVKPQDIATFLGKKLHGNYQGEVGNNLNTRILGTRIKHHMGPASLKMYDKFGRILRIEVTVNDVSFFQQYREVVHRDGTCEIKWAPMQKTIASLAPLREVLAAATQRYLKFLSDIATPEVGVQSLNHLTQTLVDGQHRYKGFTLLSEADASLFRLLLHGEFAISGFSNKALRQCLSDQSSAQVSRLLKRLRVFKLIKKVGQRYKYYLTDFGRQVATMVLKLRELQVIPTLAHPPAAA
jgi:hypothetical protein